MTSKFDEIRPYTSADLPQVLQSLVNNPDLINTLVAFRFAHWPAFTKPFIGATIKWLISRRIKSINSLREFQSLVEPYMQRTINKSTSAFTITGLDTLDLSKPCLFVSNHRDIALDPAFVNWALHLHQQNTVRIAVGDNLLTTQWIADLIRLNKCFVVKRSIEGRREKLNAAKLLSEYVHHSLHNDKSHIWIAQREGRAKDGIDLTNPAVLSMLTMNKPKSMAFGEYVEQLRIVPVSISYEYDPCDINKAKELAVAEEHGSYSKPTDEDMRSIVAGITGQKGKVSIHFGRVIGAEFENTKDLAEHIDMQILANYQIFPTSHIAHSLLSKEDKQTSKLRDEHKAAYNYLQTRLAELSTAQQDKLLHMYANPIIRMRNGQ
ncbi:MAG: 1-acyl-sn-glycerol-3-phosphate acyltransferase [Glaciecola sp.]